MERLTNLLKLIASFSAVIEYLISILSLIGFTIASDDWERPLPYMIVINILLTIAIIVFLVSIEMSLAQDKKDKKNKVFLHKKWYYAMVSGGLLVTSSLGHAFLLVFSVESIPDYLGQGRRWLALLITVLLVAVPLTWAATREYALDILSKRYEKREGYKEFLRNRKGESE